jgi:hypothetical protein
MIRIDWQRLVLHMPASSNGSMLVDTCVPDRWVRKFGLKLTLPASLLGLIPSDDGRRVYSRRKFAEFNNEFIPLTEGGAELDAAVAQWLIDQRFVKEDDRDAKNFGRAVRDLVKSAWHLWFVPTGMDISKR